MRVVAAAQTASTPKEPTKRAGRRCSYNIAPMLGQGVILRRSEMTCMPNAGRMTAAVSTVGRWQTS